MLLFLYHGVALDGHHVILLLNVSTVVIHNSLKSIPKLLHLPLDKVLRDHQRPVSPHPSRQQIDVRHPHVPLNAPFEGSPATPVKAVEVRRTCWPLSSSFANDHHSEFLLHLVADPSLSGCCSMTPSSILNPNGSPQLVFCVGRLQPGQVRNKDLLDEVGRVESCLAWKDEELRLAIRSRAAPGHVTRGTLVPAVDPEVIFHIHSSGTSRDENSVPP